MPEMRPSGATPGGDPAATDAAAATRRSGDVTIMCNLYSMTKNQAATVVGELRPSIGDSIAIGTLRTRVPLKVFDFTVFDQRAVDRRHFVEHSRYDFITQLQTEISRPVRPHERQREYIATQIVAEYLKSFFGCDAIIYRSSMQRDEEQDNRNIVILNRDGFVGDADPCVLSYAGWSMEDVTDVRYTTVDGMAF
jgi:RES domain